MSSWRHEAARSSGSGTPVPSDPPVIKIGISRARIKRGCTWLLVVSHSCAMMRKNRPKNVKSLHCCRCGPSKNHLEFLASEKERAYYLERPSGDDGVNLARNWNYLLFRGDDNFKVGQGAIFRIYRNQEEANVEFLEGDHIVFKMEWAGKGDVGGLAAAPMHHTFSYQDTKYSWHEQSHLTGKDFVCKDMATKRTVAYFRAVMTPQAKEGKLEISDEITDKGLEDVLVATLIAYREWCIRRTMLLFGDPWFNQSVTG